MKGTSKVGQRERLFQVAPRNHIVLNGKPSPEAKSDLFLGAFIKRRISMDLLEKTMGCLELLQSTFMCCRK